MGTSYLPTTDDGLAAWGANASQKMSATPTQLGITAAVATQVASLFAAFNAALAASNDPATRGPARTLAKRQARENFVAAVRAAVRQIQGTPTVTDAQRQSLGITVPKKHYQPAPAPGTAYKFEATLDTTGAVTVKFKCDNPRGTTGTIYQVFRKIGAAEPTYVGGSGTKDFTDATVPAGTSSVTYSVQAVRSTAVGAWAHYTVNFAVGGAIAPEAKLKLAA